MKKDRFYRNEFTDLSWYELMKACNEDLPKYEDIFDEYGEFTEKYHDIMTCDIYILEN